MHTILSGNFLHFLKMQFWKGLNYMNEFKAPEWVPLLLLDSQKLRLILC